MIEKTRRVAVIGGNRIPFARSNGAYSDASNQDMLTAAIDGLVARFGLEGQRLQMAVHIGTAVFPEDGRQGAELAEAARLQLR